VRQYSLGGGSDLKRSDDVSMLTGRPCQGSDVVQKKDLMKRKWEKLNRKGGSLNTTAVERKTILIRSPDSTRSKEYQKK